ncbi:MAG: hypothetical protein GY854_34445 [Deltaproteobacteria bacterium]|nr:hypothetical protein [Deltaproteobacteria bacterium]
MVYGKHTFALVLGWMLVASSCSTGAGDGRVWGSVDLPGCGIETDNFDMDIDFFAADYYENTLRIRLQRSGQDPTFADGVLLIIRDVEEMAEADETEYPIHVEPDLDTFIQEGPDAGQPTTASGSPAQVALYLNRTCPDSRFAFTHGAGTLQMESIYVPNKQKRIAGSFHFEFIDHRYWESAEDFGPYVNINGEFDFNYSRGKPAQTFP